MDETSPAWHMGDETSPAVVGCWFTWATNSLWKHKTTPGCLAQASLRAVAAPPPPPPGPRGDPHWRVRASCVLRVLCVSVCAAQHVHLGLLGALGNASQAAHGGFV